MNDFAAAELVASSAHAGAGVGADLADLYITWDAAFGYIGLTTNNSESWNVAYGFALDVDQTAGSGQLVPPDAWGRAIGFSNPYLPEYQVYGWWDGTSGAMTTLQVWQYSGGAWAYVGDFAATEYAAVGDATTGLQYLEFRFPWAGPGVHPYMKIYAWVAGDSAGSSAVDTIPYDANVQAGGGAEWTDMDLLAKSWEVAVDVVDAAGAPNPDQIPDPGYSPNQGQENTAVAVSSFGALAGGGWVALAVVGLAAVVTGGMVVARRRR